MPQGAMGPLESWNLPGVRPCWISRGQHHAPPEMAGQVMEVLRWGGRACGLAQATAAL